MQQLIENRDAMTIRVTGKVTHTVAAQAEGDEGFDAIDIYRRHRGLEAQVAANAFVTLFEGPHDRRLTTKIAALFETVDSARSCLVYIHRGYQPNYRTPMLQSLLAILPKLGGVSSLRARSPDMPPEARAVITSQLACFDHVLVINDQHERLSFGPESSREAVIEFTLIDRVNPTIVHAPPLPTQFAKLGLATTNSGAS